MGSDLISTITFLMSFILFFKNIDACFSYNTYTDFKQLEIMSPLILYEYLVKVIHGIKVKTKIFKKVIEKQRSCFFSVKNKVKKD